MVKWLSSVGVTSDMAYGSAIGSVVLSILIWALKRGGDRAAAERFGIFVGLWAPTLAIMGRALEETERQQGIL